MKATKMKLFAAAAALGVLATITLGASTASADKCTGTKIKAISKKESGLLSCSAKEATKGTAAVEPDCDNKAMSKFQPAYAKPGAKGQPVDSAPGGCLDKASTKFMTAFNAQSGCTGDGMAGTIESLI